jgi:hypothetical protein
MTPMNGRDSAELLRAALNRMGTTLTISPGRSVSSGLHEVREFGPALRASLSREGVPGEAVLLNQTVEMANWNRQASQVDLVVGGSGAAPALVAELKVWDIGDQLFDLAKVCCLLAAGARAAFLISVARQASDFDRLPGGELFPALEAEVRRHDFVTLIGTHRDEWRRHVGKGAPEPTAVPAGVITTGVAAGIGIDAYPGHSARAAQVTIADATPIPLDDGWPRPLQRP